MMKEMREGFSDLKTKFNQNNTKMDKINKRLRKWIKPIKNQKQKIEKSLKT